MVCDNTYNDDEAPNKHLYKSEESCISCGSTYRHIVSDRCNRCAIIDAILINNILNNSHPEFAADSWIVWDDEREQYRHRAIHGKWTYMSKEHSDLIANYLKIFHNAELTITHQTCHRAGHPYAYLSNSKECYLCSLEKKKGD